MMGEALLELRLVDPDRNRDRIYVVEIDDDLFGAVIVTVTYGRSGSWSRPMRVSVANREAALRLVRERLRRRRTARRRLGASYVLVAAQGSAAVREAAVKAWHRMGGADLTQDRPRGMARLPSAPDLPLFGA